MDTKWILIDGVSRGIGNTIAKYLLDTREYSLIMLVRNKKDIQDLLCQYESESFCIEIDLNNLEKIDSIFKIIEERKIKLSGFIHSAGLSPLMAVHEIDLNRMIQTYNVNYFSFIMIMKHLANPMYSYDGCKILALSSIVTNRKGRRQSIYASSKAALEHSTHYFANELLSRKFSIVSILLGVVYTEMFEQLCENSGDLLKKTLEKQPFGILSTDQIAVYITDLLQSETLHLTTGIVIELNCGYL